MLFRSFMFFRDQRPRSVGHAFLPALFPRLLVCLDWSIIVPQSSSRAVPLSSGSTLRLYGLLRSRPRSTRITTDARSYPSSLGGRLSVRSTLSSVNLRSLDKCLSLILRDHPTTASICFS